MSSAAKASFERSENLVVLGQLRRDPPRRDDTTEGSAG